MERVAAGDRRDLRVRHIEADFVVAGGGLAGLCAAITAAREGIQVVLIQDRPVLGGNASSEVRLWALGATSHMGNNNRWAREGGVIDEILSENRWRNPEGNPVIFDSVLLDFAWAERNLTLLLDTAVTDIDTTGLHIDGIRAFSTQNSTEYVVRALLYCDATGDGFLGFRAGAAFRVGAEAADEFDEPLAPDHFFGELLGSTIFFYSKDTGKPVNFVPPRFALDDIAAIPRYERIRATDYGCSFWWLEHGGRLDTVHDSHEIKRELLRVVYGVWNYIKNSGRFPEAETLTLEWTGLIPGKRESRRFEGAYVLTQGDLVHQRLHRDAVSFGGWAMDLHPADGVFSELPACVQYHTKGVYQIPYGTMYSRDVDNLFLAGRLISATHVSFSSTRVMLTGAHNAQVVGMAAALCTVHGTNPHWLSDPAPLAELQRRLIRRGQWIPHVSPTDPDDLVEHADIRATPALVIDSISESFDWRLLEHGEAMLIPFARGSLPLLRIPLVAQHETTIRVQLRQSSKKGSFTPDRILEEFQITIGQDSPEKTPIRFKTVLQEEAYLFVVLIPESEASIACSSKVLPGVLCLHHSVNPKVARASVQEPPEGIGIDHLEFEFWLPKRQPAADLWAMEFEPSLEPYSSAYVSNGFDRPFYHADCWVPDTETELPNIELVWPEAVEISEVVLSLDGEFDQPLESVQIEHYHRVSPYLPRRIQVRDHTGKVVASRADVHFATQRLRFDPPLQTKQLSIEFPETWEANFAVYRIRAYR